MHPVCIPFILSGTANKCWLHTCDTCVIKTWRFGLQVPLVARNNNYTLSVTQYTPSLLYNFVYMYSGQLILLYCSLLDSLFFYFEITANSDKTKLMQCSRLLYSQEMIVAANYICTAWLTLVRAFNKNECDAENTMWSIFGPSITPDYMQFWPYTLYHMTLTQSTTLNCCKLRLISPTPPNLCLETVKVLFVNK